MSLQVKSNQPPDTAAGLMEETYEFPVSFAQQRLWFLDQFEPGSPFYNIPVALRIRGVLDEGLLTEALAALVERHEILRTTFEARGGEPVQVVWPNMALPLAWHDLRHLGPAERQSEALRLADEAARRPFDLSRGPLLRAHLWQVADAEHIALFVMHHIISDGWSIRIMVQEIAAFYAAAVSGLPADLPELPIQYADFAHWQREWLQGDVLQEQLDYWTKHLGPETGVLELPGDRPRPAVQTSRGATLARYLPSTLRSSMQLLATEIGTTPFMLLLAAFQVLLYRLTGQLVIHVGSPIANRNQAQIEALIGFFANTLVFRAELHDEMSFNDLLVQVRRDTLDAYAHQDLPFEMLVEALETDRDMSHSPLFQVMFILQNIPGGPIEFPSLTMEALDVDTGTSTFDLTLIVTEEEDGLDATVEYNTDLFDRSTIARLLSHYEVLLSELLANPDMPIAQLPLLTATERRLLLHTWNDTTVPFALDECIHTMFEAQARRHPGATAVVWGDQTLTYDQLNRRANKLAHALRARGVVPETQVAICLERSLEMIVAVLAVLKAGGGFVPLNPDQPRERLQGMLADCEAPLLITQKTLLATFDGEQDRNGVLCLDTDWDTVDAQPDGNLANLTQPHHLAYMIYTSGSTGQAKGVLVEHRNLVNAFKAWEIAYSLEASQAHLQMADFSFDVFCGDLVRALLSGGKLVLCPRTWLLIPEKLYALLQEEQIAVAEFVPVVLRQLMQYLRQEALRLDFMRFVICGSDSWYVSEYRAFQEWLGESTQLVNSFGLTEATIDSCFFAGSTAGLAAEQIVPIGRPFANMQLYVLDSALEPLPIGVPGELYVGGAGVVRGYHHNPELTAARFLPDPFCKGSGVNGREPARLYRTGDKARFLNNGNIEFLGRLDTQLKIRGYRIEPGEIEAALLQHVQVGATVVAALPSPVGDTRLVAYIVPHDSQRPTSSALRRFLQERIPDYMVPTAFVLLDELPLLPNGKIDRRSLPEPDWSKRDLETKIVLPRNRTERKLAEIWQGVLGKETVSVHDNFFILGGHSLLATQLVSRIRDAFEVDLSLRQIFEAPTIATLAELVEIGQRTEAQAPPMIAVPRDSDLPLSFAQQRLWFLDQMEPNSPFYNMPEAVRLSGELDAEILERCLNALVQRHEVLRTTFPSAAGKPSQRIAPALKLPLEVIDLTSRPPAQREEAAQESADAVAQRPFDLAQGPLLHATLIKLDETDHIFLLTLHHIISDEWSIGILVSEIALLYDAFSQGRHSPLPALALQYADYACWQRDWLQGEVLAEQLDYWQEVLAGSEPIDLPTDRPRPALQSFAGDYFSFELPPALSTAILDLCQAEGVTPFMLLLAALQTLLHRYSHQDQINVGTPIANRNRADVEGLVGFFINTLVLRGDFAAEPTFRELMRQTRDRALGAYAHQDVPFEMVVDALQPERDLSRSPLFQVMLVIQNTPAQRTQKLPALEIRPVEAHSGAAKFDLTLFMLEEGGQLTGAWEYSTALFDKTTIARMAGHFETMLAAIVADPDCPVTKLALLPDTERAQLLTEWNDTAVLLPHQLCVQDLFAKQVQRTPQAVAVRYREQQLTYEELDQRANQLAHALQAHQVGPDKLVALLMGRVPEVLIGILGTLKAGGAYVPLDPSYPVERLRFMLDDARPLVVLTQGDSAKFDLGDHTVLHLDQASTAVEHQPHHAPPCAATSHNLAYVIYTSGSTGQPKGTMLLQQGLVNYLTWCQRAYPISEGESALVHSSISFDLTITGLLAPLLCGGCVHLLPEEDDLGALAAALQSGEQFGMVKITPAHLELLSAQVPGSAAAACTRGFIIGGENLLADGLAFWQTHAPQTQLFNEYGPTETVVGCCVYEVPSGAELTGSVPIGRPIINTSLFILDKYHQPVPIGVVGELAIGGIQVARGYLNRPELTAERFIDLPFEVDPASAGETQRVYLSGDRCRYRTDGQIEFLGRLDDQVKIHGFRIELGEIEAALLMHPTIQRVAVCARPDNNGHKQLVAYYVAEDEPPSTSALRAFLEETLPAYMIPAFFIGLEALPLTANGKVDRRALPEPGHERPNLEVAFAAPRDEREQALAAIWHALLGIDQPGIHDNFFALGGDSILAIQLVARAREAGINLSPRHVFQQPTIAGLAATAEMERTISAEQGAVSGEVPLTPVQHWFFEHAFNVPQHWNQALLLELKAHVDAEHLRRAVGLLTDHHDALRLRFAAHGRLPRQEHAPPGGAAQVAVVDLTQTAATQVEETITTVATRLQSTLDLEYGPLLQVALIRCAPAHGDRLVIVAHHLVIDGYSWAILLQDLADLLGQLKGGQSPTLPHKSSSFKSWATYLDTFAQTEDVLAETGFWLRKPPLKRLPRDFDDPEGNLEGAAASLTISLTREETGSLLRDAHNAYRTDVQDLLLSALALALAEWTGEANILVQMEGHGRDVFADHLDLTRTIGWFTTLYPLQLAAEQGSDHRSTLLAVKEQRRQVPLKGIGYGVLRYLSPESATAAPLRDQPPPEISFNYLGQMDQTVSPLGLFAPAPESVGPVRDPGAERPFLLEIDGAVMDGRLQLEWTFATAVHRRETIQGVADSYLAHLRALLDHCLSPEAGGVSPADVQAFGWDADDLADIMEAIKS